MDESDAIALENVSVKFNQKIVLKNISFKVERTQFVTIIGPNGSGKTTLIKTILGL